MDTIIIIYIISILIWLIMTICFFVLCADVAKIKKALTKPDHLSVARRHLFYGDIEEAKSALKELVWNELQNAMIESGGTESMYNWKAQAVKSKYERYFVDLGIAFPDIDAKKVLY